MSGNVLNIEKDLAKELELFSKEVLDGIDAIAGDVAKEAIQVLKTSGSYLKRTGDYRKSFYNSKLSTYRKAARAIASKEYQRTHLLEKGHLNRNGTSRTRAFPHWEKAENYATTEFEKQVLAKWRK